MALCFVGASATDNDGRAFGLALGDVALNALTLTLGDEWSTHVLGNGGVASYL